MKKKCYHKAVKPLNLQNKIKKGYAHGVKADTTRVTFSAKLTMRSVKFFSFYIKIY